jgi:hypothetical protein
MNRENLTETVRKSVAEFVRGHAYDSTEVRELFCDGQDLADQIVEDILCEENPPPASELVKKQRQATATTVSICLGRYRDDEDGKPLGRAIVRKTRFGPIQYGGFKVTESGVQGIVTVRWVAPDDMDNDQDIKEERANMLAWYADILMRSGYGASRVGSSLHVTRPLL